MKVIINWLLNELMKIFASFIFIYLTRTNKKGMKRRKTVRWVAKRERERKKIIWIEWKHSMAKKVITTVMIKERRKNLSVSSSSNVVCVCAWHQSVFILLWMKVASLILMNTIIYAFCIYDDNFLSKKRNHNITEWENRNLKGIFSS